ncbi:unnamed protein product [Owenia fusiformis]|uniref:Cleavage stimulation factor 50 kDa subunit n=1 Tax=Owenia fusiformis TaxID=6347 RepID=A0A8J1TRK0_OWEFU|nr:unnamed protein product [Owenia fusiformis]
MHGSGGGLDIVKEREQLYRLMISQLFYDGYQSVAVSLANIVKAQPACPPSDKLQRIVRQGLEADDVMKEQLALRADTVAPGSGIDLEFETDVSALSPEVAQYETCYVTAHKGPCRVAKFHDSGMLIATGSEDTSIKILDVERMLSKSSGLDPRVSSDGNDENHPVIRTLYDHNDEITTLDFHPQTAVICSGSLDHAVKFFDYSKPSVKKSFKSIQEAYPVKAVAFHPSGDFLLVGTEHPTVRLYDTNTFQCYVASNPADQHTGPITDCKYSPNANMYITCSEDGSIKVWDGVSNKCTNTFTSAHDGAEVCSVQLSRNNKYILSSGMDSLVKLWELSTARCLIAYTGAGTSGKQEHRSTACFNHTEDYVLFPDERTKSLCVWDSRNAERQKLLSLGHNLTVRCIQHSPTGPSFISTSDDFRARFWYRKASTD